MRIYYLKIAEIADRLEGEVTDGTVCHNAGGGLYWRVRQVLRLLRDDAISGDEAIGHARIAYSTAQSFPPLQPARAWHGSLRDEKALAEVAHA